MNHAEAIRIRFDPVRVSYGQLLKVFFAIAHDPTQLNRQGKVQKLRTYFRDRLKSRS